MDRIYAGLYMAFAFLAVVHMADGVPATTLFFAAHFLAVGCFVAVAAIENRRHEFPFASNFRDVFNLVAMAALGAALVAGGFRAPAAFLLGFYHWLVLYGVSRLSLRATWAASIVVPLPTLLFRTTVESAIGDMIDIASL